MNASYDADKPLFLKPEIPFSLEIVSDSLKTGDNWEHLHKRKTAAKLITEASHSISYYGYGDEEENGSPVVVAMKEK